MGKIKKLRQAVTLRVELAEIEPAIWRRFVVTDDFSLAKLHMAIQPIMGWSNTHLFAFIVEGREFTGEESVEDTGDGEFAENFALRDLEPKKGTRFQYLYDFGDGWSHNLVVESIGDLEKGLSYPVCLAGERSCPPEDCGGPYGYSDLLEIIADATHEEHVERMEWLGPHFEPEAFDVDEVNEELRGE